MAKVDPIPDQETLEKRREPKWVVNPKDVKAQDEMRVRKWGFAIMQKHESRLKNDVPVGTIVFQKEVSAEEIDIKNVYNFEDLGYFIMRQSVDRWVLRILYKTPSGKHSILAELGYATIGHV